MSTRNTFGHTPLGWVLFCVPAGIAALLLWHALLKRPLLELTPESHRVRLLGLCAPFCLFPVSRLFLIVAALLLGAATHTVWDSFTHVRAWGPQHFPALQTPVLETSFGTLRVAKLLQHGSTLLGLGLLLVVYFRWLRQAAPATKMPEARLSDWMKVSILLLIAVTATCVAAIYAWRTELSGQDHVSWQRCVVALVLAGGNTMLVGFAGYGAWWNLRFRKAWHAVGDLTTSSSSKAS